MSLWKRIVKKIARRFRPQGFVRSRIDRPGRNFQPVTAVDLWQRTYRFKETPAARAGTKLRTERERKQRKARA